MRVFDLKELEAATESFSPDRLIGKGSHGNVYRGFLTDGRVVAVKKQSLGLQKLRDNTRLENEARILSSLSPNSRLVINHFGIGRDDSGGAILVTEYFPNGTLHDLLHTSATPPTWPSRIKFALQLARAVRLLHGPSVSVVHRDIKTANILLDEDWNARLADFGLAARLNSSNINVLPAGTIGYIDPNYTTPSAFSAKIDVYSYGVVLLELISGRKAIDVTKSPASLVDWALPLIKRRRTTEVHDARVPLPVHMENTVERLLSIAALCLSPMENLRPPMSEIVEKLEDCAADPPIQVLSALSLQWVREIVGNAMATRRHGRKRNNALMTQNLVALWWSYLLNKYIY